MLRPSRKRVQTLDSFFASTRSPSHRQTLYKMIPKRVQLMENKSKERKWRMKAVKEKQQMRGHSRHGCSTTHGHTLKMERCFAIFVANRRRQIHLDQLAVQISGHDQLLVVRESYSLQRKIKRSMPPYNVSLTF